MTDEETPLGAAKLPGAPAADGWVRLHPLSPLLRGGVVLIVIAGIVFANFRDHFVNLFFADRFGDDDSEGGFENGGDVVGLYDYLAGEGLILIVLGAILVVIALIVLIAWISWRFSTYRISDDAVESRRGVLFRSHRRAPLERIQSVNLQRSLFARIVGLTKIEIATAGTGGKVELAYLGYRDAQTVREQILRRAAERRSGKLSSAPPAAASEAGNETGAPAAAPIDADLVTQGAPETRATAHLSDELSRRTQDFLDADVDPVAEATQTLLRVPVGRLLGSIALGWEAIVFVILLVVVVVFGAVVELGLILGIIPLLIVMIGVMFGQFNKGFNFTLSRGDGAVRIGTGLTSTTTETIPLGRIHAVEARQPLGWRPLGWWKVRITVAGHSIAQAGQNGLQNIVLPVGSEADVLRVFDTLLPGISDDPAEVSALRDGLVGPATGYVTPGPRAAAVLWWGRRRAGLRVDGFHESGAASSEVSAPGMVDDHSDVAEAGQISAGDPDSSPAPRASADLANATLRTRHGVLTRVFAVMPIVRAQSVQLRRPLLHRALGLASIQAHTVLGPVVNQMRGIELEAAQRIFDELSSAVLTVQRADAEQRSQQRDAAGHPNDHEGTPA